MNMQKRKELSEAKTEKVFIFIVRHKFFSDGNSPTYREIAAGCNVSLNNVYSVHLDRLREQGRIDGDIRKARCIEIVGGYQKAYLAL